jgi:histidinol-phosphatase (PHP family)
MLVDTHVHLLGHRDRAATTENIRAFLEEAVRQNLDVIGFTDHEEYLEDMRPDLIRALRPEYPRLRILVGVEMEYRPGEEDRIRTHLARHDFDYAIGSVHELAGWAFDRPEEETRHRSLDADDAYRRYFDLVAQAAASGLFQVLGHMDLIKIFGLRPTAAVEDLAAPALDAIARSGILVEINTNGRYKPVGEWYPGPDLAREAVRRGISFTLGSDAHEWRTVGREVAAASVYLQKLGVKNLFEKFI